MLIVKIAGRVAYEMTCCGSDLSTEGFNVTCLELVRCVCDKQGERELQTAKVGSRIDLSSSEEPGGAEEAL